MVLQLIDMFKLRIGLFMVVAALAGYAVTPGLSLGVAQLILLALVTLAASGAAGAFNQYAEWDLDRLMPRTAGRPFAAGTLARRSGWLWLIAFILAASVALAAYLFNPAVAVHLFLGAFFYGIVYTLWLKRRTPWNIVIGGASGSFAVLVGASAADPGLSGDSIVLAIVLFLWTPPHFWALAIAQREAYARAGVPMLPVVRGDSETARIIFLSTLLLVAASVIPVLFGMGAFYLTGALLGGGYFLYRSAELWRDPARHTAMRCFLASLVQLLVLMLAAIFDALVV